MEIIMETVNQRKRIILDGEWNFTYKKNQPDIRGFAAGIQDKPGKISPLPAQSDYEIKMPVPGYWDDEEERLCETSFWARDKKINPDYQPLTMPIGNNNPPDMSLPYLCGTGWYQKSFYAPLEWEEKLIKLYIGGAVMETFLWINGEYAGHHTGHLTPFSFQITDKIKAEAENEIVIAVSNIRTDRIGCSIRGNKGKSGGITRTVYLEVLNPIAIKDCYVHTDENGQRLYWNLQLDTDKELNPGNDLNAEEKIKIEKMITSQKNASAKKIYSSDDTRLPENTNIRWKIIDPKANQ